MSYQQIDVSLVFNCKIADCSLNVSVPGLENNVERGSNLGSKQSRLPALYFLQEECVKSYK